MAEGEGGYKRLEYHNETIWLTIAGMIAAGLAHYGFRKEAPGPLPRYSKQVCSSIHVWRKSLRDTIARRPGFRSSIQRFSAARLGWSSTMPGIRTLLGLEPKGDVLTSGSEPVLLF